LKARIKVFLVRAFFISWSPSFPPCVFQLSAMSFEFIMAGDRL
jgi:hypothetical protein